MSTVPILTFLLSASQACFGLASIHGNPHVQVGAGVQVFDNVLEPAVLEELQQRVRVHCNLRDKWYAKNKAKPFRTRWLPFEDAKWPSRYAIEEAIRDYAKLVVKSELISDSRRAELAGVDWWVQDRKGGSPKEYHTDTDTQACHEAEQQGHDCKHLTSKLSTVFFVNAGNGGPTVVFNQSFTKNGLMPRIPQEVMLIPARTNRLIIFTGDRYHGVVHPVVGQTSEESGDRLTLLANFWSKKTDESTVKWLSHKGDAASVERLQSVISQRQCKQQPPYDSQASCEGQGAALQQLAHLPLNVSFDSHFELWQKNKVPNAASDFWRGEVQGVDRNGDDSLDDAASSTPASRWADSSPAHVPLVLDYKPSPINTQIPSDQRVPSWLQWT